MALYFSPSELELLAESARSFGLEPDVLARAIDLELEYQAKGRRHGLFTHLRDIITTSPDRPDSNVKP